MKNISWNTCVQGTLRKYVVIADRKFMVYVEDKNAFIGWRFPVHFYFFKFKMFVMIMKNMIISL